jgi:hypothetical protein
MALHNDVANNENRRRVFGQPAEAIEMQQLLAS